MAAAAEEDGLSEENLEDDMMSKRLSTIDGSTVHRGATRRVDFPKALYTDKINIGVISYKSKVEQVTE